MYAAARSGVLFSSRASFRMSGVRTPMTVSGSTVGINLQ
jgi:hypothetical protein